MSFGAHLWTLGPRIAHAVRPGHPPLARPWTAFLEDPEVGLLRLTGELRELPDAETLVLMVHGLGGSSASHYATRAAHAADVAGLSCLRLNLRGADGKGEDLYHAGLTDDLAVAVRSPELEHYSAIVLLGFSLGGHVVLRYAVDSPDPRIRAVGAICAPLDLRQSVAAIDRPDRWLYRRYVLGSLRKSYAAIAARGRGPCRYSDVRGVRFLREWDEKTVVPRFGFEDADDYYRRSSVGTALERLKIPTLLVAAEGDPMIPADTLRPSLERLSTALEVRWLNRGGHVGYPGDMDLDLGFPLNGVEGQVMAWLHQQAA